MTARLARVTFTGVDDRTDLGALRAICARWPRVEFAVLASRSRAGHKRRYPRNPVALLERLPKQHTALHTCGALTQRVLTNECGLGDEAKYVLSSGRVQFNAELYHASEILKAAWLARCTGAPSIIQARKRVPWIAGISVLKDSSGGRGLCPESWGEVEPLYRPEELVGYAGGLGPDNVAEELPRIAAARGEGAFWIDMESGVRNADDWFDVEKVLAVLSAVDRWEAAQ